MRQLCSVLLLLIMSSSLFAQQIKDDDYLKLWEEFKKENAPFSQLKSKNIEFDFPINITKPKLGDLCYKRESYTAGQKIIGIALHITEAIYENSRYRDEIWKDPAKYFLHGYYHK
nr:hypothetical protein [uncultured Marinifilum sp.]